MGHSGKKFLQNSYRRLFYRRKEIKKGDSILLVYPSGNRDEEVFHEPFKFKVDRSPNKHLAFGFGAHLCLGKHLAKMEMEILYKGAI
jgi:cytochrome P450